MEEWLGVCVWVALVGDVDRGRTVRGCGPESPCSLVPVDWDH